MLRTIFVIVLLLLVSGCGSLPYCTPENDTLWEQYRRGKEEARQGWRNAHDPEWPVQIEPPTDMAPRRG